VPWPRRAPCLPATPTAVMCHSPLLREMTGILIREYGILASSVKINRRHRWPRANLPAE
jgi:hypothetical protein